MVVFGIFPRRCGKFHSDPSHWPDRAKHWQGNFGASFKAARPLLCAKRFIGLPVALLFARQRLMWSHCVHWVFL